MYAFTEYLRELPVYEVEKLIKEVGLHKNYEHVLLLYYVEQLDYKQIAYRLDMNVYSVGNMLATARKKFYKLMAYKYGNAKGSELHEETHK